MGDHGTIADTPDSWPVERSETRYRSPIVGMVTDWVRMPGADGEETVSRDRFVHPGAVAALALDEAGRVLLLRQYRHAVQHRLWELPAGIRDVDGEPLVRTAQRELLEEAGYRAHTWHELVDFFPSPGFSTERIHVFLARDLVRVPDEEVDFVRVHEEADMTVEWLPLEEAVAAALAGRLHNGAAVIGVLAAHAAAREGFASLRPARG
ncbi:NUDIX domain-containing protein [Thermobifida cellulosilytica]|uniref:NUDIX hydrolase n=1 Tax=Thermobifida cellulosilytica TB100 TaxID=665004 RepID=A0A147KML6_THECS|nr:NUDIX hydrolase [Thermobifida cellulosilytica]KUP98552.1 NUDIX hydrolase [Thermobifida cellulosilytica TB100]